MKVNCTDESFSIVTVDPTFNLGEFYVTPMVFMQKKYVRKHQTASNFSRTSNSSDNELFNYFATQLVILQPSLRHIRAIGTDGEQVLNDLCWVHLLKQFL